MEEGNRSFLHGIFYTIDPITAHPDFFRINSLVYSFTQGAYSCGIPLVHTGKDFAFGEVQ
jgi:hypothetical protein